MRTSRPRVISLVVVVLALAAGVVLGSGLLPGTMVSGLRGDKGDLQRRVSVAADVNGALESKLSAANEFDTMLAGRIVRDMLAGKSIVLFRTPDADATDVEAMARMVGQAGGMVTGTVALTQEFVDANSAEKLRSVVNSPILPTGAQLSATLTDQSSQAGDLLGIALLTSRDATITSADDGARETVLAALRDTGFLTWQPENVGAADTAVVITGGALAEDAGSQGATVARFAAALAPHCSGIVLGGRDGSAGTVSAVGVTRADIAMTTAVTTVDDIGVEAGRITTVLALRAMIGGAPAGSYGTGAGATSVTVPQ